MKIPFSKFFQGSHGRVSDVQSRFLSTEIRNIGITCMDQVEGPFSLEIDSIAVVRDDQFYEQFAYEMYKVPRYVPNG